MEDTNRFGQGMEDIFSIQTKAMYGSLIFNLIQTLFRESRGCCLIYPDMEEYMIRPIHSLKRLSFDEAQGQVIYQYGKHSTDSEHIDYLEFIARVTSHIPDKGQVMIRNSGLYANAHRGKLFGFMSH